MRYSVSRREYQRAWRKRIDQASPDRDDWSFYTQLAVSIVNDGLSLAAIGSYVVLSHGLLYPYFLLARTQEHEELCGNSAPTFVVEG